ncbi:MAG: tetratricopeptide repeat protein [Gammaproteobacteria bacterium]|jgi:cytochrome c-type biogenesis protein CcmH
MTLQTYLIFFGIGIVGIFLFWLFYKGTSNDSLQAQKYLIKKIKDKSISADDRKDYETKLAHVLQKEENNSFKLIAVILLLALPLSIYFYTQRGTPQAMTTNIAQQNSQQPQMSLEEAVAQLEEKLKENPDDIDGQMLLARTQFSMKNYDKAVTAYSKANELAPNESVILTELAEAIALKNNKGTFLGEPEQYLAKAYELNPQNQKAIWLYGMTFYEKQDYAKTLELWTGLYEMISDEGAKKQLAEQLNDIRSKLDMPLIEEPVYETLITATVDISESLKSQLQGKEALLYIYTKETQGMPMPIAVIKKTIQLSDFPMNISMSDAQNLQPNRKLSEFKEVVIGARISFSGNAMAQKGDLLSSEQTIPLRQETNVDINIDSIKN